MTPFSIGLIVFVSTFGGALAGIMLRASLPAHHLDNDSQATVKVGIGLIATMTALVLGLVTASAKNSYDVLDSAVKQTAADVMTLDRTLARYGAESNATRAALHDSLVVAIRKSWPQSGPIVADDKIADATRGAESVMARIRALPVQDEDQAWLKARAQDLGEKLLEARWVVISSIGTSVPVPFLVVLVFWLVLIFVSFGLFAPRNGTVISILLVCALSVASAIFLILEMDGPFTGLIRISPDPLNHALDRINQ